MRQVTRTQARSFLAGIGVLVAAAVVGYLSFTAHEGRFPLTPKKTVRAAFTDVGQLNVGDEVRENSIRVGQVSRVDIAGGHAVVTMDLNGARPLYRDATAQLWDQSALGQKFVELSQGTAAAGPLGDQIIPTSRTDQAHDISDLLDVLDPPTRAALAGSLRELGGGAAGRGAGLNDFLGAAAGDLTDAGTISSALTSRRTDLPRLLRTTRLLSSRFEGREEQIAALVRQTGTTLAALSVDDGRPLSRTVAELPGTLTAANAALDGMNQPLADAWSAVHALRPGTQALGAATPDLRGVLREGVAPLDRVPGVAHTAAPAVDSLSDTFSVARPVTPKVADALHNGKSPIVALAPYSCDIGTWTFGISNLFTSHAGWDRQLRIMAGVPGGAAVNGVLPEGNDPYPAPCTAAHERLPLGGLAPVAGGGR